MRKNHFFIRFGRHGGLMKEDTPGAGGDNTGGNSGAPASGGSESNNTGEAFDPATFWTGPNTQPSGAPAGESAPQGNESGGSSEGTNLQEVLTGHLESMTFGEPIFDATIAEQINNGDFTGIQSRMEASQRAAVRESLGMMVKILRPFAEQLTTQLRGEMSETFTTRDNTQALETMFPGAKNPAVRPMIQSIYDQALKNTGGNREKAVAQTKEMLKHAAGVTASDLDISVHSRGADDSGRGSNPTINWLDELSAR